MIIETRLDFKMYLKLMYILTYRKPIMIFLTIVGFTMLFFSILYLIGFNTLYENTPYFQIIFGFVIMMYLPFSIYLSSKRNFSTHKNLQEKIIYDFNDDKIKLIGETFNSEMDWMNVYKIIELKDWFLIYHNRQVANFVPKDSFGSNLNEFKDLVKRKGLKAKLKKNN